MHKAELPRHQHGHRQGSPAWEPAEAGGDRAGAICKLCLQSPMTHLSRCSEASVLPGLGRPHLLVRGVLSGQRWKWSRSVEAGPGLWRELMWEPFPSNLGHKAIPTPFCHFLLEETQVCISINVPCLCWILGQETNRTDPTHPQEACSLVGRKEQWTGEARSTPKEHKWPKERRETPGSLLFAGPLWPGLLSP